MAFIRLLILKKPETDVDSIQNYTQEQWVQLKLSSIDFVEIRQNKFSEGKTIDEVDAECAMITDKTRAIRSNEWSARPRPGDIIMVRGDYLANGLPSLGEYAHNNGTFVVLRVDIGDKKVKNFRNHEEAYTTTSGDLNARHQYRIDLPALEKDYPVEYSENKIIELDESNYRKYLIDKKVDGIEKETKVIE